MLKSIPSEGMSAYFHIDFTCSVQFSEILSLVSICSARYNIEYKLISSCTSMHHKLQKQLDLTGGNLQVQCQFISTLSQCCLQLVVLSQNQHTDKDIQFSIVLWLVVGEVGSHRWLLPSSMPPGFSSLKALLTLDNGCEQQHHHHCFDKNGNSDNMT